MNLKKLLLLPVTLMFSATGCAGIGGSSNYNMGTTSFLYDPSYKSYMVKINGHEIGGGYGKAINTSPIKLGPQIVTWGESNSNKVHQAKNQVILTKEDLKGVKYLAVHLYPDDTIEITTSNNWPTPTKKGDEWYDMLDKNK